MMAERCASVYGSNMELIQTFLDRQLVASAYLHDLANSITPVLWAVEAAVEEGRMDARYEQTVERTPELFSAAREPPEPLVPAPRPGVFRGFSVLIRAPIELLEYALAHIPHREVEVEVGAETIRWSILGIPEEEASGQWDVAKVREWMTSGGPGLAEARLQMAARVVGATYTAPVKPVHEYTGTLRLPRA